MSELTLCEFITAHGDDVVAGWCGVKARTAGSWRRGERLPRPEKARVLVGKSQGRLTMVDIYGASEEMTTGQTA
jgi:hypothetical protein